MKRGPMQAPAGVGSKRKHAEAVGDDAPAAARARAFLAAFKALPLDKLAPNEGTAQFKQLCGELLKDADELPSLKRMLTAAA